MSIYIWSVTLHLIEDVFQSLVSLWGSKAGRGWCCVLSVSNYYCDGRPGLLSPWGSSCDVTQLPPPKFERNTMFGLGWGQWTRTVQHQQNSSPEAEADSIQIPWSILSGWLVVAVAFSFFVRAVLIAVTNKEHMESIKGWDQKSPNWMFLTFYIRK